MNKKGVFAIALFGFLLTTVMNGPVFAAQKDGDSSLQLGGNFFHSQGADTGTLSLEASYGYFLSERVELGFLQSVGYTFVDDGDDPWVASTIPFVNYHFLGMTQNNTFQPFIGAFIGASYNEDDITGTVGPQIGFKSYVTDETFITVKYRYEWFFEELEIDEIEDESSDGNHVVTLAVGFLF